jgi:F0F1-type ATP synthase delta subunit
MADWLKILREQRKEGERMRREVPKLLADPALQREQAMALFEALEKQTGFVEKLVKVLEANGYEPDVVAAAERLEGLYAELAETVAEKVQRMR